MRKLNILSGKIYLRLLCSEEFPDQEPAYLNAVWYDLFLLLIPVIGILCFIETIRLR